MKHLTALFLIMAAMPTFACSDDAIQTAQQIVDTTAKLTDADVGQTPLIEAKLLLAQMQACKSPNDPQVCQNLVNAYQARYNDVVEMQKEEAMTALDVMKALLKVQIAKAKCQ